MGESIKEGRKKKRISSKLCTNQEINKEKIRYPIGDVSCLSNLKSRVQSLSQSILNTFSLKLVQTSIPSDSAVPHIVTDFHDTGC